MIGFGGIQLSSEDGDQVFNLYYRLFPAAWGHGYAPEMAEAALSWARRHRSDLPVVIVTDADNTASIRVAEKLGFTLHQRRERDGRPEVVFQLTHPR